MEIMREEISNLNNKILDQKKSFSWKLFECEEDKHCKDNVVKSFLVQLFGYEVK